MIAPAREAAYEVLRAVSTGNADLPHALSRARARLPDERDRALASEIATGTLRWQGTFDHVIAELSRRPVARLDPEVLDILRSAIFQLLHLDRVPAAAVVSDAVNMTRKAGKKSAGPFVNALLRRISREREHLPLPQRPENPDNRAENPGDRAAALDYLATTLSHPRWLAARWLDRYGFAATEAWLQFNNQPAPLTLRVNRLRTTGPALAESLASHGVQIEPGRFAPDAWVVRKGNPLLTPLADTGMFVVQDEASQLVASLVAARAGEHVLDACASPGGKTTAIAAAMNDRGLIVATDVRGRRVDLLARTVRASGAQSVRIVQADASALPLGAVFDWVLLDVPCSGLGTIRRDPDVRWRRSEADLPRLAASQRQMLEETSRVLRPGGHLVYSTCSSEPEENEDVVAAFVENGAFRPVPPRDLPAPVQALVSPAGHLRTLPFRDGLEAFFGAILTRAE
jgi:16S rRNA (cytosine967-C5)-methyltransferase